MAAAEISTRNTALFRVLFNAGVRGDKVVGNYNDVPLAELFMYGHYPLLISEENLIVLRFGRANTKWRGGRYRADSSGVRR